MVKVPISKSKFEQMKKNCPCRREGLMNEDNPTEYCAAMITDAEGDWWYCKYEKCVFVHWLNVDSDGRVVI